MAEPSGTSPGCPRCAVLERRVAELERQLAARDAGLAKLEARIAGLETRNAALERLLEQRTRDAKRQAAPFSKGAPKPQPQKPGRKPGEDYGVQACRAIPTETPDEVIPVLSPARCPS